MAKQGKIITLDDLDGFGNLGDYKPEQRIVKPYEPVHVKDKAAIKIYSMLCLNSKPISDSKMDFVKRFIRKELKSGSIDPKLGLGFAIVSEDVLNINPWGGDYPSLLNPNIYFIHPKVYATKPRFSWRAVNQVGSHCAWEGALVGYESLAWRQFMNSEGTNADKLVYLRKMFSGEILDIPEVLAKTRTNDDKLGLTCRASRALGAASILTLGELIQNSKKELIAKLKSQGVETVVESIEDTLANYGFKLREE